MPATTSTARISSWQTCKHNPAACWKRTIKMYIHKEAHSSTVKHKTHRFMQQTETGQERHNKGGDPSVLCLLSRFFLVADTLYSEQTEFIRSAEGDWWCGFLEATTNSSEKLQACFLVNFVLGRMEDHLDEHLDPRTLRMLWFRHSEQTLQIWNSCSMNIINTIFLFQYHTTYKNDARQTSILLYVRKCNRCNHIEGVPLLEYECDHESKPPLLPPSQWQVG